MAQIRSVIRALDVLELIAGENEGLLMIEISRKLHIPPATLLSILGSLIQKDYIYRDKLSKRYKLGWEIAKLSNQLHQTDLLINTAIPIINKIIRPKCIETIVITILDGREIRFIYVSPGTTSDLQVVRRVGFKLPAFATGSGRSMLAFLPRDEIDRIYPEDTFIKLTENTKTKKQDLLDDLLSIRRNGYIYDQEESEPGVWAVSSCIRNSNNQQLAGMSIVAPIVHVNKSNKVEWTQMLLQAVDLIMKNLQ